jgi:hypothetical protein
VGTIKSVGRIYQQTFLDTYAKVAFAKLHDRKNALVAADLLNDRVLTFLEEHEIPLLRVLTDRGTEYCGQREHHEYELYLIVKNIDPSRTKARHPQTKRHLRTLPSHHSGRVLCHRISQKTLHRFGRTAGRPGGLARRVQSDTPALGQVLLWQDSDADFLGFGFSGAREDACRKFFLRAGAGAEPCAAQAEARSRVPPLDQPMRQIKSELLQFIRLTHPFSVKPEYLSKEHSIYAIVIAQSRLCGIQINSRHQNKVIPNNGGLPALSLDADSTWQKSLYGRNGTSRCLRRLLFVSVLPATVVGLWTMVHRTQQCRSPVVQKRSYEAQYLNFPLQRRLFNFFLP